jgi:hypothetical protein
MVRGPLFQRALTKGQKKVPLPLEYISATPVLPRTYFIPYSSGNRTAADEFWAEVQDFGRKRNPLPVSDMVGDSGVRTIKVSVEPLPCFGSACCCRGNIPQLPMLFFVFWHVNGTLALLLGSAFTLCGCTAYKESTQEMS